MSPLERLRKLNGGWRDVALLGLVSFIADVSGEMLSAVLPFLLVAQGAGGLAIGLVDGITEGVGDFFKFVGGQMGQRIRRTRLLIGSGYLVATLSRFGVAFATSWPATLALRSLDRVGKGLRTAPRDALLAGFVDKRSRGRAFGLHLASDVSGGVTGVLLVTALVGIGFSTQTVILLGAAIGVLAIVPLFWVRNGHAPAAESADDPSEPAPDYGPFLVVAMLFALGRLSYLFFVVHAVSALGSMEAGLGLYLLYILVQAASATLWGLLGDRWGKRRTLAIGYALMAAAATTMVLPTHVATLTAGFALLGLATGCVDGTGRAIAAQLAGSRERAAKLGEYHAMTGFAGLLGGIAAGLLWDNVGVHAAFVWGALVPLVGLAGLLWVRLRFPHLRGPPVPTLRA